MRTSGAKPLKNTVRKSPLKQSAFKAPNPAKKAIDATIGEKKKVAKKSTTETSIKTTAPKSAPAGKPAGNPASKTETSIKSPAMQMKKTGNSKKC